MILFIFCINVDIDQMLLLDKNKGLGINSFIVISLWISWNYFRQNDSFFHLAIFW